MWQDSNLQSPDPKSSALSIRPHTLLMFKNATENFVLKVVMVKFWTNYSSVSMVKFCENYLEHTIKVALTLFALLRSKYFLIRSLFPKKYILASFGPEQNGSNFFGLVQIWANRRLWFRFLEFFIDLWKFFQVLEQLEKVPKKMVI